MPDSICRLALCRVLAALAFPGASRRARSCLALVLAFTFVATVVRAGDEGEPVEPEKLAGVIRTSAEFDRASGQTRDLRFGLDMEIRINFLDRAWHNLWYESNSGLGYFPIEWDESEQPPFHAGQRVHLTGTIIPSHGLTKRDVRVEVIAEKDNTPAEDIKGRFGEIEALDRHRVFTEAYVDTQLMVDEWHLRLKMRADNRSVIGWVALSPGAPVPNFESAYIRITGIYSARVDPSGAQPEIEIWAGSLSDLEVLRPISQDPAFDIPITPLRHLFQATLDSTVRVRGRVQAQEPGTSVVIRDESGQILVETLQDKRFPEGTEVEAVGSVSISGSVCTIHGALVRVAPGNAVAVRPQGTPADPLRLVEDIRGLTPEEVVSGRSVRISGVVTWAQPESEYLFVQDVSGGVRVHFKPRSVAVPIIQKQVVIEGKTYKHGNGAAVELSTLTVPAVMRLPQHRLISFDEAMTGSEEAQWVEMHGYLRGSKIVGHYTHLDITTPRGEFTAIIQTPEHLENLRNALIRVRGVCETRLDEDNRIVGFRLLMPYLHNLLVDEDAPTDVFEVPLRSFASVRQLSATPAITRAKVSGTVLHQQVGQYVFLEQASSGLLVLSRSEERLTPGEHIEVVGLIGREGDRPILRDAVFRRTGASRAVTPTPITDASKLMDNLDGRLVIVRGNLINQLRQPHRTRLTLQSGETLFEIVLEHPNKNEAPPELALDTGLETTGIYRVVEDDSRHSRSFQILARTAADIRVFKKARIWTAQRAIVAASLLAGCALLGFAWATALRRRVRLQMNQIRAQLEKEVVLEDRHRGIVENASDFIFTTDLDGQFTSFNPAGERMTGFSKADALRMNFRDMLVAEKDKENWRHPELASSSDGTVTFQSQLLTRDKRVIWIETSSRLIREGERAVGILGIVRDISERKQIEEQLKRARDAAEANTRAKSEFLANMSHEIRTPMNAVIGMSNLLLDTKLDGHQKDFAETIRNGAEALLTVLNDILDFSKMEAGRLQIDSVGFDLRETIDGTVELLGARAAAKNLELTAFIPSRLPSALRGDPSRLRQVLLNMLGNAIKFTHRGEVILQVSLESETADEARFLFEIIDTGVGLNAEEQGRLFRPFSQADNSTTRRFGGTGLGLAISKQIVELLDGRCGVRSTVGEGSTFWFTAKFAKHPDVSAVLAADASPPILRGTKVLLVDDSTTSCRLLDHYISSWGMQTTDVNSGKEALNVLSAAAMTPEPFGVVVIDASMPGMDGLELARAIRAKPQLEGLRIVFLNTLSRAVMPNEMIELGLAVSLLKPVRQSELLSALVRVLPPPETSGLNGHRGTRIGTGTPELKSGDRSHAPTISVPPVSLRVLLAEDNLVNQRVALLQLQKLGHRATPASNGLEVLAALEKQEFDVILMDCHMPEMDGFEATRRIRENPTLSKIRVIALTANAMQGDREKCIAVGMDDYLSKPVRVAELQAALVRCYPAKA
ncbi:MAG TPA: response regulator [Opitutaceae bacterium]|nr:response regulator [Opitutaceae bacterium]